MKEVFAYISPRWGLEEGVGIIFYQYSAPLGQKFGMTHVAVEDQSLNEIGQRQTQRVGADAVAAFYMIEVVVEVAGTQVVADIGAEAAFASAEA